MDNNRISIFDFVADNDKVLYIEIGGQTVEMYPTPKKETLIEAIQWGLNLTVTGATIISEAVKIIFEELSEIKAFTNIDIDFEGKTVGDIYNAYHVISKLGIIEEIESKCDVTFFKKAYNGTFERVVSYQQSAAGILATITSQAEDSTDAMQRNLDLMANPKNMETVQNLITAAEKLGYNPA